SPRSRARPAAAGAAADTAPPSRSASRRARTRRPAADWGDTLRSRRDARWSSPRRNRARSRAWPGCAALRRSAARVGRGGDTAAAKRTRARTEQLGRSRRAVWHPSPLPACPLRPRQLVLDVAVLGALDRLAPIEVEGPHV